MISLMACKMRLVRWWSFFFIYFFFVCFFCLFVCFFILRLLFFCLSVCFAQNKKFVCVVCFVSSMREYINFFFAILRNKKKQYKTKKKKNKKNKKKDNENLNTQVFDVIFLIYYHPIVSLICLQ